MSCKLIAFVGCILIISLVSGYRGGRHRNCHNRRQPIRHHWHHHAPFVNFEVHEPKGLTVSILQRSPNSTSFGIELFINKDPKRSKGTHCDVCQNTTMATYGKFIVGDKGVVIKKGDVLYYHILLGDNMNVTRLNMQQLWVTNSIIHKCDCKTTSQDPLIDLRFGEATENQEHRSAFKVKPEQLDGMNDFTSELNDEGNALFSKAKVIFECEVEPTTSLCRPAKGENLSHFDDDLEREVGILETIVEKMRNSCGSRQTTNIVRLESVDEGINDKEQLKSFVRSTLSVNPEMRQLADRIRRVLLESGSSRVVLLDMSTYVDKQKVLYHSQMNDVKHISDYDSRRFWRSESRG